MLNVRIVTAPEEFSALRESWNGLLKNSPQNNIFLTWEWLYTWWEFYGVGNCLHIVLIEEDDGTPLAIAPLYENYERRFGFVLRKLHLLGSGEVCSEYLDVFQRSDVGGHVVPAIERHLEEYLAGGGILDFQGMREEALAGKILRGLNRGTAFHYQHSVQTTNRYVSLPQTEEEYMNLLKPKRRSEIKRRERKLLEDHGFRIDKIVSIESIERDFRPFVILHQKHWESCGLPGMFRRRSFLGFHEAVAKRFGNHGWLAIYYLLIKEVPVASLYGFPYCGTFYSYQSGIDPAWFKYGVGVTLLKHTIVDTVRNKFTEFDFLRGDAEYKLDFSDKSRHTYKILLGERSAQFLSSIWAENILRSGKTLAKKVIPPSILSPLRAKRDRKLLTDK